MLRVIYSLKFWPNPEEDQVAGQTQEPLLTLT
jgi:hypothetical protein